MTQKNRGKWLETLLKRTNAAYKLRGVALVDKVPTPWTVRYNRKTGKVYQAWPEEKSSVDFLGIAQGRAIAFEAKSTRSTTRFDLSLVQPHQLDYLIRHKEQGGSSFLIVAFEKLNEVYFVPVWTLKEYMDLAEDGGRKSIPIQDFRERCPLIRNEKTFALHYLKYVTGGE